MEYTHHSEKKIIDTIVVTKQDPQTKKFILEEDGTLTGIDKQGEHVEKTNIRALSYSGKRLYGLAIKGSSVQIQEVNVASHMVIDNGPGMKLKIDPAKVKVQSHDKYFLLTSSEGNTLKKVQVIYLDSVPTTFDIVVEDHTLTSELATSLYHV